MSEESATIDELDPHRSIAEFIARGFVENDRVVILSTPETRRGIESHLTSFGVRLADLRTPGRPYWFDSNQVLARILVNGLPDEAAFDTVMKGMLFSGFSESPGKRVRTYHDMVEVLRDRGSLDATVLLLRLWSAMCARYDELLLAYTVAELYREKDCAV